MDAFATTCVIEHGKVKGTASQSMIILLASAILDVQETLYNLLSTWDSGKSSFIPS